MTTAQIKDHLHWRSRHIDLSDVYFELVSEGQKRAIRLTLPLGGNLALYHIAEVAPELIAAFTPQSLDSFLGHMLDRAFERPSSRRRL